MEYCYIMTLDSYYESRGACWNESKLTSEAIIGPDQGIPPAPWDLRIPMPSFFQDCVRSVPVPFTQICRKCNSCSGTGQELCSTCTGSGFCVCSECQGKQNVRNNDGELTIRIVLVSTAMERGKRIVHIVMELVTLVVLYVMVEALYYDGLMC